MHGKIPIRTHKGQMDPQYAGRKAKRASDNRYYNGTGYVVDQDMVGARDSEYESDLSNRVSGR